MFMEDFQLKNKKHSYGSPGSLPVLGADRGARGLPGYGLRG